MTEWQRLDPRMLLVHPVDQLRKLLVPLLAAVLFGAAQGGPFLGIAFVVVPVALGIGRYLTTTYRIADGRIELRRGLFNRQRLSTPLDRVRTVDLTASVIHRLLGLTTVTVGTGSADDDDRISLDALAVEEGRELRSLLLVAADQEPDGAQSGPTQTGASGTADTPGTVAAAFELGWLRYAPFTSAGLVVLGGLFGALAQLSAELDLRPRIRDADLGMPPAALIACVVVALAVLVITVTVAGYLVANWRFTLSRTGDTWRLSRGLLTTHETSIDVERLAGVAVSEPPGLRLARGARLSAIVTGLDRSRRDSEVLVPPAPAEAVRRAATAVLGTGRPLTAPLVTHGAAATRRRWTRAVAPGAGRPPPPPPARAAGLSPWLLGISAVLVAAGMGLAADRSRSLGHALVDGRLIARSGSLLRKREVLAVDHVIGWTLRDTWFQRRAGSAGLVTLTATTAGGGGAVRLLDVPTPDAVALADAATPDLVGGFKR